MVSFLCHEEHVYVYIEVAMNFTLKISYGGTEPSFEPYHHTSYWIENSDYSEWLENFAESECPTSCSTMRRYRRRNFHFSYFPVLGERRTVECDFCSRGEKPRDCIWVRHKTFSYNTGKVRTEDESWMCDSCKWQWMRLSDHQLYVVEL